ncbi:MAG: MoaD family protein [Anaerolineae bacterium]|nr:MoaD family protein [Anaerolineae bacterium]MCB9107054.1 MoaD family protein [Anaerolineales bacterium]
MKVTVKLFARLRELTGAGSLDRTLADEATIADLIQSLQQEFPKLAEAAPKTIISVNQEFADLSTPLAEGDEVALFPPVSGGSGAEPAKFAITFDPISLDEMATRVVKPETGAVAVFGGVVRNVSLGKDVERLEYEAYEEMAVTKLKQVAAEARQQWPKIVDIAIVQRIGRLEVGENAVVVAVSSPHRGDGCFEACAYAINRLKEIVPIWKKEFGPDGDEWIEGDYLPSTADAQ